MCFYRRLTGKEYGLVLAARGFTLVELMFTITIMAILLAVAAPSLINAVLGNRLNSSANNLIASAILARSEAIKRNKQVAMCVSSNGATCATGGWEQGWIVTCRTTDHVNCDPTGPDVLVLQRQTAATGGLRIADTSPGAVANITFSPSGVGATVASLRVCRATPSAGSQERVVEISATGRAYVRKTSDGTCP